MASLKNIFKRSTCPLIFGIWTGFLIYLLMDQRYTAFLRPEFSLLLIVAHFIAMGFMLAAIADQKKATQYDFSALIRSAVLLVPIVYFLAMSDTMLGSQAFKKRFTGTTATSAPAHSSLSSQGSEADKKILAEIGLTSPPAVSPTDELTIFDVLISPASYKGQKITLTGMFMRDPELKNYLGGRETALYRFLINCCAADAIPLAIALNTKPEQTFPRDQWVQAEGIFTLEPINGKSIPVLQNIQLKPVLPPRIPFLY